MTELKKKKKTIKEAIPVAKKIEESVVKSSPVKKEIPVVDSIEVAPQTRPRPTKRIKATTTTKGIVGNYQFNIVRGEIYVFPDNVANFLIQQNKAF